MNRVLKALFGQLRAAIRLMVGVPDYDAYVRHRKVTHPGTEVMTYEEFFRNRQERRYETGAGKCC